MGHRQIVAVTPRLRTTVCDTLRQAVQQYAPEAFVDCCFAADAAQAVEAGATALVVDGNVEARQVVADLRARGIDVPGRVSVAGIGCVRDLPACSGYYSTGTEKAQAVARLLRQRPARPVTLWMTGRLMDAGTIAACGAGPAALHVSALPLPEPMPLSA
jgi:DNA-binding LacI/PurR family transcriptional regulator